jgi:hypothetical protein
LNCEEHALHFQVYGDDESYIGCLDSTIQRLQVFAANRCLCCYALGGCASQPQERVSARTTRTFI